MDFIGIQAIAAAVITRDMKNIGILGCYKF